MKKDMNDLKNNLQKKHKVFVIGSHKTGTTSLEKCLNILGYKLFPLSDSYKKEGLIFDLEKKNYDKIINAAKPYNGFADSPWNHSDFYKTIDSTFEESKFILSVRDSKNWVESLKKWDKKMKVKSRHWYSSLSKTCYEMDSYMDDLDKLIFFYENRNKEVIEYFKGTDKLLVMDLEKGDGWESLCEFLNHKTPNVRFPHLNKTK